MKKKRNLPFPEKEYLQYIFKVLLGIVLASLFMKYVMERINPTSYDMVPFFACIGVLVAMTPNLKGAIKDVINRNIGTVVAAVVGAIVATVTENILIVCLGFIPYLLLLYYMDCRESIVPGGIFYFAIVYLTTYDNAWMYAFNRAIGTIIGTLIGLTINYLIFPQKREENKAVEEQSAAIKKSKDTVP